MNLIIDLIICTGLILCIPTIMAIIVGILYIINDDVREIITKL